MSRESALKKSLRANKTRLARARARLRNLRKVEHQARAKVLLRKRQLNRLRKPTGAKAAVKYALAQVGTTERPYGSNRGPKVDQWALAFGRWMLGQPWCGSFAGACLRAAGLKPTARIVYCPNIITDARSKRGYTGFYPWSQRQLGDLVLFRFPGSSATADHVGIYVGGNKCCEGNTSPGSGGNQSNGGGVYIRTRNPNSIVGCARPRYR